jgi:hypothetical protein
MLRIGLGVVSSLLLLACASPLAEEGSSGPLGGKADGWPEGLEAPVLDESYALYLDSTVEVMDTEDGELSLLETHAVVLLSVEQEGASVVIVAQPCQVVAPEIAGRQPTIDEEVILAMAPTTINAGFVAEPEVRLITAPAALQLGVELVDPIADSVPEDEDDPRVIDVDLDGDPGVSVRVSGFRVYAGVRVIFSLSALVDDPAAIVGDSHLDLETQIYGDNIPFFDARKAADTSEVVSEVHLFELESLAAIESPTCASLL